MSEENVEKLLETNRQLALRLIQIEEIGWTRLSVSGSYLCEGITLEQLKDVSTDLIDMSLTSPLIRRAISLRHGYVFGKGMTVDASPTVLNVLENPYNRDSIYSSQAFLSMFQALDTTGNVFILRHSGSSYSHIPLSEITAIAVNDFDSSRIEYIKRSWTDGKGDPVEKWIPLARHKHGTNKKLPNRIGEDGVEVDKHSEFYHFAYDRPAGYPLGIPTALAAKSWLVQYTEYLHNNSLLVKALSRIAWKVVSNSDAGAKKASAEIVSKGDGVAGTANIGAGQDVQAVSRGNDVNFNNGQPLAAMVATAFGVPVIALLSSPGATGGSYGAATTLDEPTLKINMALQEAFGEFLKELYNGIKRSGAPVELTFPPMSSDANYRQLQSAANLHQTGALHQEEYREIALSLLQIRKPTDGLPKPDGFNSWQGQSENDNVNDPLARQGNAGAVPGGMDNGDTNHDNDVE